MGNYQMIIASGWNKEMGYSLLVSLVIILALMVSSIFLFKKQEVER
jgi:hypothetical protein